MVHRGQIAKAAAILALAIMAAAAPAGQESDEAANLVRAARTLTKIPTAYDGSYRVIPYPGGDPGPQLGVCTDLVIRSYRAIGLDLQALVHEDMKAHFKSYPAKRLYDQRYPDPNIDHRRVPNLMTFFARHGRSLELSLDRRHLDQWQPGDVVVFDLVDNGIPSHIGIISDRKTDSGLPLVFHHFPPSPSEEDCLKTWKIIGHYRYLPEVGATYRDSAGKPIPVRIEK